MFSFNKKQEKNFDIHKFHGFWKILQTYSPCHEKFDDSLSYFLKMTQLRSGSIFLYEEKNNVFLLKHWSSEKPVQFSFSAEQEFFKFLKLHHEIITRKEFSDPFHELKQPALFFFQQTISTLVYPIFSDAREWLGFLCCFLEDENKRDPVLDQLIKIYAEQIKTWILYMDLSRKYKKLSALGKIKNEILSNITHEFQTPLNGILGLTEGMLEGSDGEFSPESKQHIEMIHHSGEILHNTLNNIIKLTELEAQKEEMSVKKVNVLELTKEVFALYESILEQKQIRYTLPSFSKDYEVFVDADHIRTVLMNLISNAIKFTEKGEIHFSLEKNGEKLQVSFSDTGMGIPLDQSELIFEEFYQIDGSKTRPHGGIGLGLALARKIINLHGGRIWVEPNREKGSTFTFTLPIFPG